MSAWTVIAHTELSSGTASEIVFSSIPATYDDLLLVFSGRVTTASTYAQYAVRLNGTTANYSERNLIGVDGATASGSATTNQQFQNNWVVGNTATASTFSNNQWYFANYRGNTAKSISYEGVTENNSSTGYVTVIVAKLWNDTAAINAIRLFTFVDFFSQYSSATLYGITKGSSGGVSVS